MVKKIVSVETSVCDFCLKEERYAHQCISCGKDICYDCEKLYAHSFSHGVFASGSGDGVYCHRCVSEFEVHTNPLFLSYQQVRSLRYEYQGFQKRFEERRKKAEEECRVQYEHWEKTEKGTP